MKKSPVWHPFTQHGLNEPVPLVTHAEGAALHTADGRRVIDAISVSYTHLTLPTKA